MAGAAGASAAKSGQVGSAHREPHDIHILPGAKRRPATASHRDVRRAQPSSMNVIAQIDNAVPLAAHSRPNPHWHKVG
ncbi:hypothetical protein GCM10009102_10090 [Sphingomonas insulae]|uniref:Uncharacterized protein n=1 Tax=Sphingomonas insulae TaxID=424800 RepID=A0ABN1HQG3_9SPHN